MNTKNIKRKKLFYYINHKNLLTEIKQYGFALSMKSLIFTYLGVILGFITAGYFFKLPTVGYITIITVALLLTPMIIIHSYKSLHEQKKFSEANKYIEKMLYYFKTSAKILDSLESALKIFNPGTMYDSISAAIQYINTSNVSNVEEKALKIIEDVYAVRRIKTLHKFMVDVEYKGGDPQLGIEMLLNDRNLWAERILEFQQEKFTLKKSVIIGIIFTLALCLSMLYLPIMIGLKSMDISGNTLVQLSAVLLIIFLIMIYYKFNEKLAKNWLDDKKNADTEYEKKYQELIHYDRKKALRKSFILAAISTVILLVLFAITKSPIPIVIGILIILFSLVAESIGRNVLKKDIIREMNQAFPVWLLDISLLMQNENVHMSIAKSYRDAPGLLKPAIKELLQELDEEPNSPKPFNHFLANLDISEIHETMSSLYSLSTASGGDFPVELREIISRNYKLMDKAEKNKNSDKVTLLNMYIIIPSIAAAFKLMVDMTVLLLTFLSSGSLV